MPSGPRDARPAGRSPGDESCLSSGGARCGIVVTEWRSAVQEIIAVLGAGSMGSGIARVFGRAGHEVRIFDVDRPAAARAAEAAGASAHDGIASAVDGATIVLEAAPERLALKRELLAEVEAANGDALIASNTSSIEADALAAGKRDPSRLVIAHFLNHADTVPLVEVVPGPATPQAALDRMVGPRRGRQVRRALAQQVEGIIADRLQAALYREAMHLVELGVASPAGRSGRHGRARAALGARRPLRDHGPRGPGRVDGRDLPDARGRIRRPCDAARAR